MGRMPKNGGEFPLSYQRGSDTACKTIRLSRAVWRSVPSIAATRRGDISGPAVPVPEITTHNLAAKSAALRTERELSAFADGHARRSALRGHLFEGPMAGAGVKRG